MADNTQSGMPCSEFDALLMEAVEGKLTSEQSERFRSHADSCGVCGPLFADAKSGFAWLQSLEEVEPPAVESAERRSRSPMQIATGSARP